MIIHACKNTNKYENQLKPLKSVANNLAFVYVPMHNIEIVNSLTMFVNIRCHNGKTQCPVVPEVPSQTGIIWSKNKVYELLPLLLQCYFISEFSVLQFMNYYKGIKM